MRRIRWPKPNGTNWQSNGTCWPTRSLRRPAKPRKSTLPRAASVGGLEPSLTAAALAWRRIDFAPGMHRLLYRRKAGAIACRTFKFGRISGWLFHLECLGCCGASQDYKRPSLHSATQARVMLQTLTVHNAPPATAGRGSLRLRLYGRSRTRDYTGVCRLGTIPGFEI